MNEMRGAPHRRPDGPSLHSSTGMPVAFWCAGEKSAVAPLAAILLLATFCLSAFDITEHDYWWHLATGKYIISQRAIPHKDVFSYTATRPWVAHYWLSDVIGYALYCIVGTPGLIVLNALVIALSFWMVFAAALSTRASPLLTATLTILAVYASRSRFYVRPETFSFFFMALYLFLFYRWKRGGSARQLFVLPFLQLLWTNLYGGGSVIGLILLVCFTAGEVLNYLFSAGNAPRTKTDVGALALSALAAFGLSFVNPNTYRTVFYFLMSRDPVFRHIVEWRHMEAKELLSLHGLFLFLGAFLMIRFIRRVDFSELALFLAFGYMSVDAPRSLPFFAIASVPIIASRAQRIVDPRVGDEWWGRHERWIYSVFALGVSLFTLWYLSKDVGKFKSDYEFGFGVNKKLVPVQAVDFIVTHGVRGPMFNSYGIGGYLIWRLYPGEKVFVDGRVEMYGTEFLKTYMFYWHPDVWNDYVKKYHLACAIIDREPNYTTRYLDESTDWKLVFFDDRAMVYVRNIPEHAALIRTYGYRYIRPGATGFDYLDAYLADPMTAGAVMEELKRSLHDEAYNLNAHLMLGHCYTRLGRAYFPLALQEYRAAARIMPEGKDIQAKIRWLEKGIGQPFAGQM